MLLLRDLGLPATNRQARKACALLLDGGLQRDGGINYDWVVRIETVAPYVAGQFYLRELPCLLTALAACPPPDTVVIDGYVWLGEGAKPGLGAHLYEALSRVVPVIGVAKTRFRNADPVVEITRGRSRSPLFVSAAGIRFSSAAQSIRRMHGLHRLPTLLRRADRLSRSA
jgi:deoxyribonuclease V